MRSLIVSIAALALLTFGGCGGGASAILLTIDSNQPVPGIDHLRVVVTNNGQSSMPTDIPLTGRPVTIPPSHTVQLRFADGRSGSATIQVDAMDEKNKVLATRSVVTDIKAGVETSATVLLIQGNSSPDGGTDGPMVDMKESMVQFAAPMNYGTGMGASTVITGDFNGDGRIDLATTNYSTSSVSILIGNGDASFKKSIEYQAGSNPTWGAVGDWNGDLHLDLALATSNPGVSLLLGNGDGTLQAPLGLAIGSSNWIGGADMDGDRKLDLVVANQNSNILVFPGNGDGTFRPALKTALTDLSTLAIGDLDGDAITDVLASFNGKTSHGVIAFLNDKTGNLKFTQSYFNTDTPIGALRLDRFNQDERLDVALTVDQNSGVVVRLGNGNGTFQSPRTAATAVQPLLIATGDIDGDGNVDIVAATGMNSIEVMRGKGDGSFGQAVSFAVGLTPFGVALADLNGDGKLDVVMANPLDSNIAVLVNQTR